MKKIIFSLIIFLFILPSCKQWKVSSLSPKKVAFIKNGVKSGNVMIKTDEYALDDLSFGLGVYNDKLLTVDNISSRVQVLGLDNNVELVIGSLKNINRKEVNASPFNFSIIGTSTMDTDGNIYIQNRLKPSKRSMRYRSRDINFSPSYILVFNEKGKLQYTLGQKGTLGIPFYYIEKLDIDKKGRLFVISRSFDTWTIFRFTGKKRDLSINLSKIEFEEKEGEDIFKGKIENIRMYKSGEKILISVAFYHGLRLKYRKVFNYSIPERKIVKTVVNIPDPKNVLFNLVDDKHIYFWNMDSSEIKFMICNMEGTIINNVFLDIDDSKSFYSRIITDDSGEIFSYQATRKGINLIRWE